MDAFINPVTRDYDLASGQLARDPAGGLANAVYLRLMTPLGSYWADPKLGSRLHELQREKDVARVPRLAQQYAEVALATLVSDLRVQSVSVSVLRQPGRLLLTVTVTTNTGSVATFHHPVKVAG
jgi:phage gp46-like protein